jgi:putative SOS response-associated peptidase YedK
MCGRFTISLTPAELQEFFDLFRVADFQPRYNIAPTQTVPVIRTDAEGHRVGDLLRWGLVPVWAKSAAEGSKMINCRSESAATKPAFRRAFKERRCLVPASGFFEWQAAGNKTTQPWYLTLKSGNPAAFAGLWESWHDPEGKRLDSFTILTTTADDFMGEVHDRMPIALDRDVWPVWLDPEVQEPEALQSLLVPSLEEWQRVPVSSFVNSVKHDSPECIKPVAPERKLFD